MLSPNQEEQAPTRKVTEVTIQVQDLFLDVSVNDNDEPDPPPGTRCTTSRHVRHTSFQT